MVEFVVGFAEADHQASLGGKALNLGAAEEFERTLVLGLRPNTGILGRNGFDVVVEDVRFGVEDLLEGGPVTGEVGDEDFDRGGGTGDADASDCFGPDVGTAVREIVASNGGDHAVFEVHASDGFGDALGFAEIGRLRVAGGDVAEGAVACAGVAEDQDGGGAAGPAFAEVGTHGGLADGVEMVAVDILAERVICVPGGQLDA